MRKLLIPLVALGLASCAAFEGLMTPGTVAERTTLDEEVGRYAITGYLAATKLAQIGFRTGLIAPSQDADVQRRDFCDLVLEGRAVVTDLGGKIAALDCQGVAAVRAVRAAYRASNAQDYGTAAAQLESLTKQITALVG